MRALYDLPIPASLLRWIDELRDELRRRPFRWWPLVPNCGGRLELEGRLAKWQTRRLYPRRATQTRQPLWTRTEKFHIILLRGLFLLTAAACAAQARVGQRDRFWGKQGHRLWDSGARRLQGQCSALCCFNRQLVVPLLLSKQQPLAFMTSLCN